LLDAIDAVEDNPSAFGGDGDCFFYVLDRLAHVGFWLLDSGFGLRLLGFGLFGTLFCCRSWVFGSGKTLAEICLGFA